MHPGHYDLAIVGAGICGLAHALAAARRGKKIVVIDRDAQANGASVRNFGFVTVTGQQRGACWQRAMRSRDVWLEVARAGRDRGRPSRPGGGRAPPRGERRPRSVPRDRDGRRAANCSRRRRRRARFPALNGVAAALYSPHEIRVESRTAIPRLAAWLAEAHGVTFLRGVSAKSVAPPEIDTSRGVIMAEAAIVCPGDDFVSLFPERLQPHAADPLQAPHAAAGADRA